MEDFGPNNIDASRTIGANMLDGGIEELSQGVGGLIVGGGVPNHANNIQRRTKTKVTMHAMMNCDLDTIIEAYFVIPAMGTGRSKKEAKHTAAKAVLDKLIGVESDAADTPLPNSISDPQNLQEIQGAYGDDKVSNNPIGSLQELCMSRHWPPPKYAMEGEEGLPHERQFTIVCSILKYRQVGQGKSKKLAKRQAAHKMWLSLQENNTRTQGADEDEIVQKNANVNERYASLKESKIATLTSPHSHKVSQFHKNLKSSTGVKLFELQNTCLSDGDVNLVQFLQEIASEQQFEVTYVDIEEKSISDLYTIHGQLNSILIINY
ncbi:hypothetical protein QAD02_011111 [Eretmocerus hayati]|uniref:Uncharacterized protein n=1 Tax=Eretmocerus hayati TaxID=131215 RepID=A0ACC2NVL7_9HYME|nr:hypothetical protein QAD02_011111 [Eretmocerus hayati]